MSESPFFLALGDALRARTPTTLGALPPEVAPASVLVPFFVKDGAPYLLLIKRPDGNYRHAGQLAFPGGRREATDATSVACALREAEEEIALAPSDVTLLGELDELDTVVSGFRVTPVVGVVPYPYPFRPAPREIERILEVRFSDLLEPSNAREEWRDTPHGPHRVFHFAVGYLDIWGVTAAILVGLLEVARDLPGAPR